MDPAIVKVQPRPDLVLAPDHALSQSAGERDWRPTGHHRVPIVVPVLASQVVVTDLAAPILISDG